jgi:excinuclease UvrABC nuclease subunit
MIIYKFYSKQWDLLYIGRTIHGLKARIGVHFSSKAYEKWKKEIKYVSFARVKNIAELYLYEIYLISVEKPLHNIEFSDFEKPNFSFPPLRFSRLIDLEKFGLNEDEKIRLLKIRDIELEMNRLRRSSFQERMDRAMEEFSL